jgi:hypothetical protein
MLTWLERIAHYEQVMRQPAYMWTQGRWAMGVWFLGNQHRKKNDYHGGYQGNYLKRIAALFPDKVSVLHAFSGMIDLRTLPGDTVDIRAELHPTYVDDCQTLLKVPLARYDLAVADPPYTAEDANYYGTPMVQRNRVMAAFKRLPAGAHVVWLDQMYPMFSSEAFQLEAVINVIGSTNNRVRDVFIWRRLCGS